MNLFDLVFDRVRYPVALRVRHDVTGRIETLVWFEAHNRVHHQLKKPLLDAVRERGQR